MIINYQRYDYVKGLNLLFLACDCCDDFSRQRWRYNNQIHAKNSPKTYGKRNQENKIGMFLKFSTLKKRFSSV
jgi:hypothetical protein